MHLNPLRELHRTTEFFKEQSILLNPNNKEKTREGYCGSQWEPRQRQRMNVNSGHSSGNPGDKTHLPLLCLEPKKKKEKRVGRIVSPNPPKNNSRHSACLTCMRPWVCKSLASRRRKWESGKYSPICQKTQTYRFRKAMRSLSNRETQETPSRHTITKLLKHRDKGGDRKQQERHIAAPKG